jgi:phage-related protein (TIGR01555 family)
MDWQTLPPRFQNWNDGWGDPIFASIYDELRNYSTLYGNIATMTYDFVTKILKVENLAEAVASDGCNTLTQRINILNLAMGATNTAIIDTTESLEKHTTQLTGLADIVDRFMLSLSAVSGIPVAMLFGRSPAGLNATGDSDVRNFYDRIKQYQEIKLKPLLERLISYLYLSKESPLGGREPDHWSIQFVPLWQNTQEQEANIRRTIAEADAIYLDRGVLDAKEVAISRFAGDSYSMNTVIDVEARENGYDPLETAQLEVEKKATETPGPGIGPNYFGNPNGPDTLNIT